MAFAEIIDGVIVTINRTGVVDAGQVEVPDSAMPGDIDNGDGTFTRPEPPEPTQDERYPPLAPYQFDAIIQLDGLKDSLDAVFASLPDTQRIVAQAKMNRMTSYWRSDPLLNQLAGALGLTDEQVNDLWTQAREL